MGEFVSKAVQPLGTEAHDVILHVLPFALKVNVTMRYVSHQGVSIC